MPFFMWTFPCSLQSQRTKTHIPFAVRCDDTQTVMSPALNYACRQSGKSLSFILLKNHSFDLACYLGGAVSRSTYPALSVVIEWGKISAIRRWRAARRCCTVCLRS